MVNYKKITQANNKKYINSLAKKLGISVPRTFQPKSIETLYSKNFNYPVVIKLLSQSSSVGLNYAHSQSDLIRKYEQSIQKFNLDVEDYPIIQNT